MAFGQPAGPPASARTIEQLEELLERAGFSSFREARHPYGLNQRQAAGRFTVDEAEALLERLLAAEAVQGTAGAPADPPDPAPLLQRTARAARPPSEASLAAARRREERRAELLGGFGDDVLVAELERRGWCCIPPLVEED